jgi:hypothetical protein
LKKTTKYAPSNMLMDISGKDHTRIFKSIIFYRIDEVEGLNVLKNIGVTYVTKHQVTLIMCTQQVLGFHFFV